MATVKKRTSKKSAKMESFKLSKSKTPFVSFKITKQTIYWAVLLTLIFILFIWVLNIQIDTIRAVNNIYVN